MHSVSMMYSALGTPLCYTYTLRKRRHPTPVSPVTEEAAASAEINVVPDHALSDSSDDIPTDCDFTSKPRGQDSRCPGRPPRHQLAVADLPQPDAASAAEAECRLHRRCESLPAQNDGGYCNICDYFAAYNVAMIAPYCLSIGLCRSSTASDTMPAPSDSHACGVLLLQCPKRHGESEYLARLFAERRLTPFCRKATMYITEKKHVFNLVGSDKVLLDLSCSLTSYYEGWACFVFTCVICCKRTGYSRCFALEQFIDAIRVSCSNTKYGCDELITHDQKEKDESACTHAPCFCPEDGYSFIGSTGSLLDDFVIKHGWLQTNLHYKKSLRMSMARDRPFALFVGEDISMFLLTNTLTGIGNALSLVCIRPHKSVPSYSSKISAVHGGAEGRLVFQMDPLVASSSYRVEFSWASSFCWFLQVWLMSQLTNLP